MDELMHQVMTALRGMWRRRWIGLAVAWAVAVIGAIVLLRIPDRYEATARVYVDTQTVLKPLMAGLAVQPNVNEQIAMLARTLIARPNVEKIIRSADLDLAARTQIEKDRLVDSVSERIKFLGVGRENIYSISYQDVNPDRAKRVVQDLLSLFVESGVGDKRRDSEAARRFIDEQIKGYEKKLEEAESRVKDFKIKNAGFTSSTGQDYYTRVNAVADEVQKLRLELRAAEESRDALKRELVGEDPILLPDTASSGGTGSTSELDTRIREQTRLLDELMRRYTDQHPDVVTTKRLIASLEEQKKQELDARRKAAAQNPATFSTSTNPVFQ
jgi:polysaccharide chain length determinant protein (PEP-CTERM system associated)